MVDETGNGPAQQNIEALFGELQSEFLGRLSELVDKIETSILGIEQAENSSELMKVLYRDLHSLKGSGGTYGFPIITTVCHQFEDYLQGIMDGRVSNSHYIEDFLGYIDLLRNIQKSLSTGEKPARAFQDTLNQLWYKQYGLSVRILIVDPVRASLGIYKSMLKSVEASIAIETDGYRALGRLLREPFEVLITSNSVPSISGSALIAATKLSDTAQKDIYTIMMSTSEDAKAKLSGAVAPNAFLGKSAEDRQKLAEIIEKIAIRKANFAPRAS